MTSPNPNQPQFLVETGPEPIKYPTTELRPGEYNEHIPARYQTPEPNSPRTYDELAAEEAKTNRILDAMKDLHNNPNSHMKMQITPGHEMIGSTPAAYAAYEAQLVAQGHTGPFPKYADRYMRVSTGPDREALNNELRDHIFAPGTDSTRILRHLRGLNRHAEDVESADRIKFGDSRAEVAGAERAAKDAARDQEVVGSTVFRDRLLDPNDPGYDGEVQAYAAREHTNAHQAANEAWYATHRARRAARFAGPSPQGGGSERALDADPRNVDNPILAEFLTRMEQEHRQPIEAAEKAHRKLIHLIDRIGNPDDISSFKPVEIIAAIEYKQKVFDAEMNKLSDHDSERGRLWEMGNDVMFQLGQRIIAEKQGNGDPHGDFKDFPATMNPDGSIRMFAGTVNVVDYYPDRTAALPEEKEDDFGNITVEMVRRDGAGEPVDQPSNEVPDFKQLKTSELSTNQVNDLWYDWQASRDPETAALAYNQLKIHIDVDRKHEQQAVKAVEAFEQSANGPWALQQEVTRTQQILNDVNSRRPAQGDPSWAQWRTAYNAARSAFNQADANHAAAITEAGRLEAGVQQIRAVLNPKIAKREFLLAGSGRKEAPVLYGNGMTEQPKEQVVNGIRDRWIFLLDGSTARRSQSSPGEYDYFRPNGTYSHTGI